MTEEVKKVSLEKIDSDTFVAKIDGEDGKQEVEVHSSDVKPLIEIIKSKHVTFDSRKKDEYEDEIKSQYEKSSKNEERETKRSRLDDEVLDTNKIVDTDKSQLNDESSKLENVNKPETSLLHDNNNKLTDLKENLDNWLVEQKKGISEIFESLNIDDTANETNFSDEAQNISILIEEYNNKKYDESLELLEKVHKNKSIFSSRTFDRSEEWLSKLYRRLYKQDNHNNNKPIEVDKVFLSYLSYQEVKILSYILTSFLDKSNKTPVFWTKEFLIYLYDKTKYIERLDVEFKKIFTDYKTQYGDIILKIIFLYFSSIYGIFVFRHNKLEIYRDTTKMNVMMNYKYFKLIENYSSHCRKVISKNYRLRDSIKGLYKSRRGVEINIVLEQFEIINMIRAMKNGNLSINNELKLNTKFTTKLAHAVIGLKNQRMTQRMSDIARNTYKKFTGFFGGKTQKRKYKKSRRQRK